MGIWDTYSKKIAIHGGAKRNASILREVRFINNRLPDNLSYFTAHIYHANDECNISKSEEDLGIDQNVAIINSDNLNEKTIISMPGEDLPLGSLIYWMDNYWLMTERDANTVLYTKGKLLQCNHLLKWMSSNGEILEQWCVIEDGTKYLSGEYEDRSFATTRGDSRISLQIAKNKFTDVLNRENRFLIDDEDSPHKLSYQLSKPLKKGMVFNGNGTYKFVLQEVTATEYDNHELGIADYYRYFPRDNGEEGTSEGDDEPSKDKEVWI